MFNIQRLFVYCAAFLIACAGPGLAQAGDPADYPSEIRAVEQYLNALKTGQARFVQTAYNGTQLVGTFYLQRPGKLRFEYDPPIEDFVVADGIFIYFYDSQLGEQMNMPIGQSLADFILRDKIAFSGDVVVSDVERSNNLLQVTLRQKADLDAGSLMFAFSENPLVLKKWRVTDSQNLLTEVELFYLKTGLNLDDDLFRYTNPEVTPGGRYNE